MPGRGVPPYRQRQVVLEFSENSFARLEKLRKDSNAASHQEILQNALRVYEWLVQQHAEGCTVWVAKGADNIKQIIFEEI